MNRIVEILLGLPRGFLARDGEFAVSFDPRWPGADVVGNFAWNALFVGVAVAVVVAIYRREGRTRNARLLLGGLRLALLLLLIALLNRPIVNLTQSRVEPSVLAVMVDESMSMRLADAPPRDGQPRSRLAAALDLLGDDRRKLVEDLAATHELRFYLFGTDARAIEFADLYNLRATAPQTRLAESVRTVVGDLQGQRLAGVVLLTDGRETTDRAGEAVAGLKDLGARLYAVPIGTDAGLRNVEVSDVAVADSAFVGDVVGVKLNVRTTGLPAGTPVRVQLKDAGGTPILDGGKPVEATVVAAADGEPQSVELQFAPANVGTLDLLVAADPVQGEIDEQDNARAAQVAVLDANLNVLYVDGYPRWEYRFLRQEMIRDKSVAISLLLTSADQTFFQEGDRPVTRFPESLDEMLEYDVVVFGDVDPRQFTDGQLQLVSEFVGRRGGGFGMVSGPQFSPHRYRDTAVEPLLPVDVSRVEGERPGRATGTIANGFRIALTEDGREHSIFRFYRDPTVNADFIRDQIQLLFWYCRGVTSKPGVGTPLAVHPAETGPDGRPAPLVVIGRFGAGRTLFSGIDDSWRWRYYTGEQVFTSYWVQTLRHLARGKKLGQRRLTLASERPAYQLGEAAGLTVRVLDPQLAQQLGDQLNVQLLDDRGTVVTDVALPRRAGQGDVFTGGFTADRIGRFTARLASAAPGVPDIAVPVEVSAPRLELSEPRVDRVTLGRLASDTGGAVVDYADAAARLPGLIPSARRDVPLITGEPLWDAPVVFGLFVLLITTEWVVRKLQGLV